MSNLVIVAIPDENDRVWKISSEKVPHLSLLFLGDSDQVSNLEQIVLFVEHASSLMGRFHLSVDRRGELGADQADVIFFKKNRYEYKAIRDFRATLLQDNNIKTAYDSATQFEGPWNPHLTLGYPTTPAKPDKDDYGFYSVEFTKIAVWIDDYDGPEFLLKDWWDEYETMETIPMDVAMSSLNQVRVGAGMDGLVEHYGTKGMKWGVRNERIEGSAARGTTRTRSTLKKYTGSRTLSQKTEALYAFTGALALFSPKVRAEFKEADRKVKVGKADEAWEKGLSDGSAWVAVNNASADHFNKHIDAINNKYPKDRDWSKEDYANPKSPDFKRYMKDIDKLSQDSVKYAAEQLNLKNPSGSKEVEIKSNGLPGDFTLHVKDVKRVKHAASDDVSIRIKINYQFDNLGRVTGFTYSDDSSEDNSVAQTIDLGAEFLIHYGTKGMRWGVRREHVERAAESSQSRIGKTVREAGKFARDVEFEAHTTPRKTESGADIGSVAAERVVHEGHAKFKKEDLPALKSRHPNAGFKKRLLKPLSKEAKAYRADAKQTYIKRLETTANSIKNASGTREYTIRERGGDLPQSKYYWEVSSREARHAAGDDFVLLEVAMDEDGYITGLNKVENSVAQTIDLGAAFLEHYGVKGQKWGVRKDPRTGLTEGEHKREGIQRYLDPQGHDANTDVAKALFGVLVPVVAPVTWPAQVRLIRGGARGAQKKVLDHQEKKFAKNAMSPKTFVAVHNGASEKINREIVGINKRYSEADLKKPAKKKQYDNEVHKLLQDAYRESANSLTNRANTMHLDLEFKSNPNSSIEATDFTIHAKQGPGTPQPHHAKHAAADDLENEEITVEVTGKIKRNAAGYIVGLDFDHLDDDSAKHAVDLGAALVSTLFGGSVVEHYGVKGMRWGVRRQGEVSTQSHIDTGLVRRRTQVTAKGGESHPAHDDAVKAAIHRQKLKKSGTDALSNQELRELANRIQLENQVTLLTSSKGKRFVQQQLEEQSKQEFKKGAARAAPHVIRKVRRGAAVGAAAAALA